MSVKNRLVKRFPMMYQIYYEHRTNNLIKRYKTESKKEICKNLEEIYHKRVGLPLDLNNPRTYTAKIQRRKIYGIKPIFSELSDKYAVRAWVAERIGENYLIPLCGMWESFDQINFSDLPDKFVLKTNNASGTNYIVSDKKSINLKLLKRKFDYWMKMEYWFAYGYEMQYKFIPPKIIAETYIQPECGATDLRDYKFLCFDGKVCFIWVDEGRYHNHRRFIFDSEWNLMPFNQMYPVEQQSIKRPDNLKEMITIAEKLATGFDHVRVDLYNSNGKIYFGEMTFTNGSGFEAIVPSEWDEKLGEYWR